MSADRDRESVLISRNLWPVWKDGDRCAFSSRDHRPQV